MPIYKELSEKLFISFRQIIYQESGINCTEIKKALMQARIMKRIRELKLEDYEDYYDYLNDNYDSEKINLINCITTNKTDFFREPAHFTFLSEKVIPGYASEKKKEIKIWSAGCSTGEEPYSIAITVIEACGRGYTPNIKILATDIDTEVLKKAKQGIFKEEVIDDIDIDTLKKYFYKGRGENQGLFKIKDPVRRLISFRRLNLLGHGFPMKKKFDIIFCRNVIIYFDKDSQKRLFENFHRYLNDDGYLFVGHSETLTGITDKFNFMRNTVYTKKTG